MSSTLKAKLLAKSQRTYLTIQDPDGDEWMVQSLTELEKSKQDMLALNKKTGKIDWAKTAEAKLRFIASCLVDPDSKERLLADDDWQQLGEVRAAVTSCIYSAALEHNGYESDEIDERLGESS